MLIAKHYCNELHITIDEFINKYDINVFPSKKKELKTKNVV